MSSELTPVEKITAVNVRTAAQFPTIPKDLSPELRGPVEQLRLGKPLKDAEIVAMGEAEVQHNSNF